MRKQLFIVCPYIKEPAVCIKLKYDFVNWSYEGSQAQFTLPQSFLSGFALESRRDVSRHESQHFLFFVTETHLFVVTLQHNSAKSFVASL